MEWVDIASIVFLGFVGIRLIVVLSNFLFLHPPGKTGIDTSGSVDVCIPARNESDNLPNILNDLDRQTYSKFRIFVYDDNSEDDTGAVLEMSAKKNPNIIPLRGIDLPEGWSGKNHACHQLAKHSTAPFLLFLDADVRIQPNFIEKIVGHMNNENLKLLSFFPVQIMQTYGERLVVPLINWILLTLLPMPLIKNSRRSSFSAANGQCMVFNAENYRENYWHKQVKSNPVEDIAILKKMKKKGYKVQTLLGNKDIACRMYHTFGESVKGVARSAPAFFGNNWIWAITFISLVLLGPLFFIWTASWTHLLVYIFGVLLIRLLVGIMSKQSLFDSIFMHLLQMTVLPIVVIKGFYTRFQGKYQWKNRQIDFK